MEPGRRHAGLLAEIAAEIGAICLTDICEQTRSRCAALTPSLFPLGGILGNLRLGWVMDRTNPRRVNACAYVVSAAPVLVIGSGVSDRVWLAVLIFLMLGVGRRGAVAGAMMSMGLPFGAGFMLLTVPAFVAALALFALSGMRMPGFDPALAEKAVSTAEQARALIALSRDSK